MTNRRALVVFSVVLIAGGLITLISGAGYLGNADVNQIVASLDIVAGAFLTVAGVCCIAGLRGLKFWKICLCAIAVEAAAGVGMTTVTVLGGVLLILICASLVWRLHTDAVRRSFGL